jgi:hypothetical protein
MLGREYGNRLRVAALLLIWALSEWVVSLFSNELSSPAGFLATVPLCIIYLVEKNYTLKWLGGLSLPVLAVAVSSELFLWVSHKLPASPLWLVYGASILLVAALCFMIVHLWTYDNKKQTVV